MKAIMVVTDASHIKVKGTESLIEQCWCDQCMRVQVNYINAHATSTLVGDVAEVKAIKKVFTDMSHVKVNGTKSLIGHCLGAAGGLEAVATIQAIRTGWLHPTLNQVCFPSRTSQDQECGLEN